MLNIFNFSKVLQSKQQNVFDALIDGTQIQNIT